MSCINIAHEKTCSSCQYFKDPCCELERVLVDASVVLETLEGIYQEKADKFIKNHRLHHRVCVTPDILGEVLKGLSNQATPSQAGAWIEGYLTLITKFAIIDVPWDNPQFSETLDKLKNRVRMGDRDQIHVVTSALLDLKFLFFDHAIKEDESSIREALGDIKYKPHRMSV